MAINEFIITQTDQIEQVRLGLSGVQRSTTPATPPLTKQPARRRDSSSSGEHE